MSLSNIRIGASKTEPLTTSEFICATRLQVCRLCGLTPEAYDEAHYDMAEEWFRYHDYLEYTAKVFMLSKLYHRWWNQQVAFIEDAFIQRNEGRDASSLVLRKILHAKIISMEIHPSAELRREMHNEGAGVLRQNPDLWHIKIYRNGR